MKTRELNAYLEWVSTFLSRRSLPSLINVQGQHSYGLSRRKRRNPIDFAGSQTTHQHWKPRIDLSVESTGTYSFAMAFVVAAEL
jgi:hypothetical protein